MLTVIPSQVEAYYRASGDFIGLKDAGKPKNVYLRQLKEKKENDQLKKQKTKSTFKRGSIKLEEKDKYFSEKKKNRKTVKKNSTLCFFILNSFSSLWQEQK